MSQKIHENTEADRDEERSFWETIQDERKRRAEYSSTRTRWQKEKYALKTWLSKVRIGFAPHISIFSIHTPGPYREHRQTIMNLYKKFGAKEDET